MKKYLVVCARERFVPLINLINKLKNNSLKFLFFWKIIIFLLVFLFTFILRTHNYDRTPGQGHLEEQMYAWAGMYLIETGSPVAWSTLPYPDRAEVYRGEINFGGGDPKVYVRLYRPWLDEPPLYSLLSGGVAHLMKADRTGVIPNSIIRIPSILLGTITSFFVFIVALSVSGYWLGILSMLIYGTVPIFVLGSRLSVAENLIMCFYLIVVYFLINYEKSSKFKWLIMIPIITGLAGLAKATGFFIIPLAIYFALKHKKISHILYLVLGFLPFIGLFLWYGYHFDPDIFKIITSVQASRPVGFNAFTFLFASPAYDINILYDSWYMFCLVSAIFFLFRLPSGPKQLISFAFIYWLTIIMISGGETDLLPWYRYPTFPFLAIAGAWGIEYLFRNFHLLTSFIAVGMFLGSRSLLVNDFRSNYYPLEVRIGSLALLSPSLLYKVFKKNILQKIGRLLVICLLIYGTYFNIVYIYNTYELDCESRSCLILPSNKLSTLHFPFIWRLFVLGPPFRHD